MADEDKQLFPDLPEDLKALSDDERGKLLADHEAAKELILEDNAEFLGDLTANEIIAQLEQGVEQIKQIKEVTEELKAEFENYQAKKQELVAELEPMKAADEDPGDEDDSKDSDDSEERGLQQGRSATRRRRARRRWKWRWRPRSRSWSPLPQPSPLLSFATTGSRREHRSSGRRP